MINFYGSNCTTTIDRFLRRTLVRLVILIIICDVHDCYYFSSIRLTHPRSLNSIIHQLRPSEEGMISQLYYVHCLLQLKTLHLKRSIVEKLAPCGCIPSSEGQGWVIVDYKHSTDQNQFPK